MSTCICGSTTTDGRCDSSGMTEAICGHMPLTMSDRDQQDECPKAFYCLPESCGDCPHDQQDGQATPDELAHEETYRVGYLDGERAATERIIGILKTVQAIDYNTPIGEQPYMIISGIIDEIREGRA